MTVASYSLRKEGEAVKENIVRGYHIMTHIQGSVEACHWTGTSSVP